MPKECVQQVGPSASENPESVRKPLEQILLQIEKLGQFPPKPGKRALPMVTEVPLTAKGRHIETAFSSPVKEEGYQLEEEREHTL
jgi:hypothetical protein